MEEVADRELTIDQLAASTGMTVRNIRAHQSRGLLPPPRIVGRTGLYGPAHVARLEGIRQLQDEGLNLAAIARVFGDDPLTAVATGPFTDVAAEYRDAAELRATLGLADEDLASERAAELGLISTEGDRVRVELPRLMVVAEELAAQGVPLEAMLEVVEVLQESSAAVAGAFMKLADRYLVAQVLESTGGDLEQMTAAVDRLQLQASAALDTLFNRAMAAEIRAYLTPPAADVRDRSA